MLTTDQILAMNAQQLCAASFQDLMDHMEKWSVSDDDGVLLHIKTTIAPLVAPFAEAVRSAYDAKRYDDMPGLVSLFEKQPAVVQAQTWMKMVEGGDVPYAKFCHRYFGLSLLKCFKHLSQR